MMVAQSRLCAFGLRLPKSRTGRKPPRLAALVLCNRAGAVFGPAHVTVFLRILKPVENCKLPFYRRGFHSEQFS